MTTSCTVHVVPYRTRLHHEIYEYKTDILDEGCLVDLFMKKEYIQIWVDISNIFAIQYVDRVAKIQMAMYTTDPTGLKRKVQKLRRKIKETQNMSNSHWHVYIHLNKDSHWIPQRKPDVIRFLSDPTGKLHGLLARLRTL
jgi:hypothetical protein